MADEGKYNEKISEEEEAMPTENLPDDLIIKDILSRLPVKSLLRFRCVCKPWFALITDPAFVKIHLSRSLTSSSNLSMILNISFSHFYSANIDSSCEQQESAVELVGCPGKSFGNPVYMVGSCNGLLCIYYLNMNIFIWNPSTRRHQKLPITPIVNPGFVFLDRTDYGFGYDPNNDDYKVVRILHYCSLNDEFDDNSLNSEVKIYSLNTNSWKRIGDIQFDLIDKYKRFGFLVNYALHWVAKPKRGPDSASLFILSLNLRNDEYGEVSLPDFVDDNFDMNVWVLGGQLCMLCNFFYSGGGIEVWVMTDYGVKESWVKQFSISIEQPSYTEISPVCYTKNGEVILIKDLFYLFLYDPLRGRGRNLRIHGVPNGLIETEIFVGSLVPLNAKDGTEQAEGKKKNRKRKK